MKRLPTDAELGVIRQVADRLPADKQRQLRADLDWLVAETVTTNGSRVVFHIKGYLRPQYRGQQSFGVQGVLNDKDGKRMFFDLFADENGRLLEYELVRPTNGGEISPDWSSIQFL